MAFLIFLLYVVMFFILSTVTELVYRKYINIGFTFIGHILAVLTILLWMIWPYHWIVVIFMALTVGFAVAEREKSNRKRRRF